jgi:hypothetical protein
LKRALVALALTLAACKGGPKEGSACADIRAHRGEAVCSGSDAVMICDGEVMRRSACRGPKGCAGKGVGPLRELCDVSENRDGDFCVPVFSPDRCAPDKKAVVHCAGDVDFASPRASGAYQRLPCRGPAGCTERPGESAYCDDSVGVVGEPCEMTLLLGSSGFACAGDGKAQLGCVNGKWQIDRPCRGAEGCKTTVDVVEKTKQLACDDSIAAEGDKCPFDQVTACDAAGTSLLKCQGGRFVVDQKCKCTAGRAGGGWRTVTCTGR